MKKLVFASAMALASMSLFTTMAVRAQDSDKITIQDPAEFNAYQNASSQTDPAQKSSALESFLTTYPQSVVKKAVLGDLIETYMQLNQPAKVGDAAGRLLQIDPTNFKALFYGVFVKKQQCSQSLDPSGATTDPQTCDDMGVWAAKGLTAPKPAGTADADWNNQKATAYPLFHSAIAFDDAVSKKDFASAIKEYTAELMLYPPDACTKPGPCLADTLQLAQAYAKPSESRDQVKAIWFYARALDYAPPTYKAQIEPQLDYWYKRYHGTLDGAAAVKQQIDAIKAKAQATLFPPADFTVAPAPTPQELAHHAYVSGDPMKLGLEDKEYILANGSDSDASGLWALLKNQPTPVPGIVISDPAAVLKITVLTAASPKPKDYVVKLTNPVVCSAVPVPPAELKIKDAQAYILANGVKADTDAIADVLNETPAKLKKITIVAAVPAINIAVTQDAKDNHAADFIVNMKEAESCKDAPAANSELKFLPASLELDGTYDSYTKTAAAGSVPSSAQIVLRDGILQQPKAAPAHHPAAKPAAAHHAH